MTPHPDEGTLHAYIDGELPSSEAAALELHIHDCERCAAALAEARGFVAAASRTISALDAAPVSASRPAPVIVAKGAAPDIAPQHRTFRIPFARAAALLLLAGGTAVVVNRSGTFDAGDRASESATAGLATSAPAASEESAELREPATVAAPRAEARDESAAQASNPTPARSARNLSATASAGSVADAALKAGEPGRASTDASTAVVRGTEARERPVAAPAPPRVQVGSIPQTPTSRPGRVDGVVGGDTIPAPRPPPTAVRLSEVVVTSEAEVLEPIRVTRFQTKSGVVLTLTEQPIRVAVAEDAAASRRSSRTSAPMRAPQSSAQGAASPAPPVMNSYRWNSVEHGRTYTLTGPLPVAELEAAARRLGELERVP